jgi:hypothetical protein
MKKLLDTDSFVSRGNRRYSPASYHRQKIATALNNARGRARDKNLPFDLTVDYLISIFPSDFKCPVLGMTMEWGDKSGRGSCPSIDRITPSKGYVTGNITWMSNRANSMKSDASPEELLMFVEYIRSSYVAVKH